MALLKRVEVQDGIFTIRKLVAPNFDDYICDLAVMFEMYPTEDKQQLHDVRVALGLIDELEKVASRLPKLPRKKEVKSNE